MVSTWPDEAQCCVNLTFNFDAESIEMSAIEKRREQESSFKGYLLGHASGGGYGPRRGVPRLLKLLRKYDIKGTFFTGGWDAERHPETIKAISDEGHEIGARGYLHERFDELDEDDEDKNLKTVHKVLSDLTGDPPKGWRTPTGYMLPRTYEKLHRMGYVYDASFNLFIKATYHGIERKLYSRYNDEVPYLVQVGDKQVDILRLPFSWILCDWDLYDLNRMYSPVYVYDLWREEFDAIYEAGGFYGLCVSCRYARATRVKALEKLIRYIRGFKDVWWTKSLDVAEWWLKKHQ